jgi:hypothetical protein
MVTAVEVAAALPVTTWEMIITLMNMAYVARSVAAYADNNNKIFIIYG